MKKLISPSEAFWQTLKAWEPRPRPNVWQWAEQNICLPEKVSESPGPYTTSFCPYVRGPMEWFTDNEIETIVMCWSAQSSKTETLKKMVEYTIAENPVPVIVVFPNITLARDFSENRLKPTIEASKALLKEKPLKADDYKNLEIQFRRMNLWLVGAGTDANLKSRSAGVVICDEVDAYDLAGPKETGALELALQRTKGRTNHKHIITSTPTVEHGQIWTEFQQGDQRYYFVPCPHCRQLQRLTMRDKRRHFLRWDENAKHPDGSWDLAQVARTAHYVCAFCEKPIFDYHKRWMLDPKNGAKWQPTVQSKVPGLVSCHLNTLYAMNISFGKVAVEFLKSKVNAEKLQAFVNAWLAEPFYTSGDLAESEAALESIANLEPAAGVPEGYKAIQTVDVQQDSVWTLVQAFDQTGKGIVLEFCNLPGLEECEAIGAKWNVVQTFIDHNYRPKMVFDWCANHPSWKAILGNNALNVPYRWDTVEFDGGLARGQHNKILRLKFRPNTWKDALAAKIANKTWQMPKEGFEELQKHLLAEVRIEKRGSYGRLYHEWQLIGRRPNHGLDCATMGLAGFESIKPLLFVGANQTVDRPPPPMPVNSPPPPQANGYQPISGNDANIWQNQEQPMF